MYSWCGPRSLASTTSTGADANLLARHRSHSIDTGSAGVSLNTRPLFKLMVQKKASDLFFTSNAPIKIKIEGQIIPINKQVLAPETVRQTAYAMMTPEQRECFLRERES